MIERLSPPFRDADVRGLATLLVDAVDSGAAVSFLAPLTHEQAETWWRTTLSKASPRAILLVARDAGHVVGSVQLHPVWAPNQPHRGEITKLLVHRRHRGRGLGERLMEEVERIARSDGYRLLTLDARAGEAAERLYRRMGWIEVGTIPRFALDPDGRAHHDAVLFYKNL